MRSILSSKVIGSLLGATLVLVVLAWAVGKTRSVSTHNPSETAARTRTPPVILWAWERPTDLSFIDPRETGVAFLARTIHLRGHDVIVRPRLQPLNLPDATTVIAVARVESDHATKPELSAQQRDKLVAALSEMASLPNVLGIQIDFDATKSERDFYREVIIEVRRRLPQPVGLSITALASWCMDDDWLSDLPIDEAVPMLFRMAADGKQIADRLDREEDFPSPLCRQSYGVSTDEPRAKLSSSRRLYVFSPDPWTESSVRRIALQYGER